MAGGEEPAGTVGMAVERVLAAADAAGKRAEFGAAKAVGKLSERGGGGGIAANGVEKTAVGQADGIGVEQGALRIDFGMVPRVLQQHAAGVDVNLIHGGKKKGMKKQP